MANTAKVIRLDLAAVVDQLGVIKAKQAFFKKEAGVLQAQLIEAGVTEADGTLFRATISTHDVDSIDWEKIAKALNPSRQLITGNTKTASRTTVKVVARKAS